MALDTTDPSRVLFSFIGGNPLGPDWLVDTDLPGERIACWSGTPIRSGRERDLFAPIAQLDEPGLEALDRFLDEMIPGLERRDQAVPDPPCSSRAQRRRGSINLIRARGGAPIEIALSPISLLTPSMLDTLEEHLERSFETLAEHAPFLHLHDAVIDRERDLLVPAPLGSGIIDATAIREAVHRHWPADKPVVIPAGDLPARSEWLPESCTQHCPYEVGPIDSSATRMEPRSGPEDPA